MGCMGIKKWTQNRESNKLRTVFHVKKKKKVSSFKKIDVSFITADGGHLVSRWAPFLEKLGVIFWFCQEKKFSITAYLLQGPYCHGLSVGHLDVVHFLLILFMTLSLISWGWFVPCKGHLFPFISVLSSLLLLESAGLLFSALWIAIIFSILLKEQEFLFVWLVLDLK